MIPSTDEIQRILNEYQSWYNEHRVHAAHEAHTPAERVEGVDPISAFYSVKGSIEPEIKVTR
jgi:hypothetical protein